VAVVGKRLSEARLARGLSVDDIAAKTSLRPSMVEAIEADNFELSGGDAYVVGHLRMIAQAIGVDPDEVISEYRRGSR
jgi:cytoskeletal protein RodZ